MAGIIARGVPFAHAGTRAGIAVETSSSLILRLSLALSF
jgi:hypothetical protein